MWTTKLMRNDILENIYKTKVPNIDNIEVDELKIVPGEKISLTLKFEIADLPDLMPSKWIDREVNAVIFIIDFINIENINIKINSHFYRNVKLLIEENDNIKEVKAFNTLGDCVFSFTAEWIFLQNIIGCTREL